MRRNRRETTWHLVTGAVLFVLTMLMPLCAGAVDRYWTGGYYDDWNDPYSWNPVGVPAAGDDVFVQLYYGGAVDYYGTSPALGSVSLSGVSSYSATTIQQNSGTLTTDSLSVFADGIYALGGGNINVGSSVTLGAPYAGTGTFSQTGGTLTVGDPVTGNGRLILGQFGATGVYKMPISGSSLNVYGTVSVGAGGNGQFDQVAGNVTLTSQPLTSGGRFGGDLVVGGTVDGLGGSGSYTFEGKVFYYTFPTLTVGGNVYLGLYGGQGSFTQGVQGDSLSGGTHTIVYAQGENWAYYGNPSGWTQCGSLFLGYGTGSNGTYTLNNGTLNVGGDLWIGSGGGVVGYGKGSFTQGFPGATMYEGGMVTIGTLDSSYMLVGGGNLNVVQGDYTLYNGSLYVHGDLNLSGPGSGGLFSQGPGGNLGGSVQIDGTLNIGASLYYGPGGGAYYLYDGQLEDNNTYIAHGGAFFQWGGTHYITGVGPGVSFSTLTIDTGGTYSLYDGKLQSVNVQLTGGVFNQGFDPWTATFGPGGTHQTGEMAVMSGTYNLYYGSLQTLYTDVGEGSGSVAVFNQGRLGDPASGGSHAINKYYDSYSHEWTGGDLTLGETGGTGTYNLYNGQLTVQGNTYVGYGYPGYPTVGGTGTFNQYGGTHTVTGDLIIAANPGSKGTYNLKGGILTAADIINNDTFNYSGGNLSANHFYNNAGGQFTVSGPAVNTVNADVVAAAGSATYVSGTSAVFAGTFTLNGAFYSDPSTVTFMKDVTIGPNGFIRASRGDTYQIAAGFINNSTTPGSWSVGGATLEFLSGTHEFLPGSDKNFAWGTLDIDAGATVTLEGSGYILGLIFGPGASFANIQSDGYTLSLPGGGSLLPSSVPIPSALLLLGPGLVGLAAVRRRFER